MFDKWIQVYFKITWQENKGIDLYVKKMKQ